MKYFLTVIILFFTCVLYAQVGIGTNTPVATAQLELSSTTKGFLPPRMTGNQRDAIVNPATGLIIYCTNCGLNGGEPEYYNGHTWVNLVGGAALSSVPNYNIGDNAYGGKIAYVLSSSDVGYDPNVDHGLIVAAIDQGTATTGYASPGDHGIALASNYGGGGYNDWRLPTMSELNKLYINRIAIGGFDLSGTYYFSGDIVGSGVGLIYFNNGTQSSSNNIYWSGKVRAVRTF